MPGRASRGAVFLLSLVMAAPLFAQATILLGDGTKIRISCDDILEREDRRTETDRALRFRGVAFGSCESELELSVGPLQCEGQIGGGETLDRWECVPATLSLFSGAVRDRYVLARHHGLVEVQLVPQDPASAPHLDDVRALLSEQYGEPTSVVRGVREPHPRETVTWEAEAMRIVLRSNPNDLRLASAVIETRTWMRLLEERREQWRRAADID